MTRYKIGKNIYADNQKQQIVHPQYISKSGPSTYSHSLQKAKLTKKETLCLELYLQGMTLKEIGKKIYRSHRTVETHVKNIREKLNANSRSEVFIKAREMNILPSSIY